MVRLEHSKAFKTFYKAENYHQDYIKKNPNGYCPDHSTGVRFVRNIDKLIMTTLNLKGKNIVVIEPSGYCPYCDKLREDVLMNMLVPFLCIIEKPLN